MKNIRLTSFVLALSAVSHAAVAQTAAPSKGNPAGSNVELRKNVDAALDSALAEHRIVGVVALVARDGKLVYHRAAGLADRENARAMRLDTVFRLSSVSKPIVTAAALALIDRGTLKLEDPVSKWLPTFRPKTSDGDTPEITIRQLLTHTAGLSYKFAEPAGGPYHSANVSDGFDELRISLEENLRRLASVELLSEPGTEWRYSLSIDVLGAVIERAAKKPLQLAVAELVTHPLGMHDTAFSVRSARDLAVPYYNADPEPLPMADPQVVPFGEGQLVYSPSRALDERAYPSGGAGMVGSALDVLRLLESIRKGGAPIVSASSAAAMMENQIGSLAGPQPGVGFGFGGAVVVDPAAAQTPQSAGTWNWGGVYGHGWFVDPVRKLTVVLMTNTTPEGLNGKLTTDVRDAVYASEP